MPVEGGLVNDSVFFGILLDTKFTDPAEKFALWGNGIRHDTVVESTILSGHGS
jgi:hypothetical protein